MALQNKAVHWKDPPPHSQVDHHQYGSFTRPGKPSHNELGRSTICLMGKSTISMAIFHSYVNVYQRVIHMGDPKYFCSLRAGSHGFHDELPV